MMLFESLIFNLLPAAVGIMAVAQAVGQADDVHGRLGVGDGCE